MRFVSPTFLVGFGIGSFVGVLLALLAIAVAKPDTRTPTANVVTQPTSVASATNASVRVTPSPKIRTKVALEVHIGPGDAYAIVGSVGKGETVDVLGRDDESEWVAIRFPPNSTARGWLEASALDGLESSAVDELAVLLPTPLASVATPPLISGNGDETPDTPAPGAPRTPTPTRAPSTAAGPADLVVSRLSVLADGRVNVVVGNRGPGDVVGRSVFVQLRDLGSANEMLIFNGSIKAGDTVTLTSSSFRVLGEQDLVATVDPGGTLADPNRENNTFRQAVTPAPTPMPVSTP